MASVSHLTATCTLGIVRLKYIQFVQHYFLLGVSAKHFNEDVSTTVSQNATTGSATLISAAGYITQTW